MESVSIRTFLAVNLTSAVRQALGAKQRQFRAEFPPMAWVRPDSIHLTLKFLGNTDEAHVEPLRQSVGQAIKDLSGFSVEVQGFGVFPHLRMPRIFWVGMTGETERLIGLVERLEDAVSPLGFPREPKSYHPHLTLARIKGHQREVGQAIGESGVLSESFTFGLLPVKQVCLFKSDLQPTGSVYTQLWVLPLVKGCPNS